MRLLINHIADIFQTLIKYFELKITWKSINQNIRFNWINWKLDKKIQIQ